MSEYHWLLDDQMLAEEVDDLCANFDANYAKLMRRLIEEQVEL